MKAPETDRVEQVLVTRARLFREEQQVYIRFSDSAREELCEAIEDRVHHLREEGVVTESHDALLGQLRGLRSRFVDLDCITRSLLLQMDRKDPQILEEVLSLINAMLSLELEGRLVQRRVALAAVYRDYVGGHSLQLRNLSFDVDNITAKRFHSLVSEVRDIQAREYGRNDAFTHKDLFERAVALMDANRDLIARMGAPTLLREESAGRQE